MRGGGEVEKVKGRSKREHTIDAFISAWLILCFYKMK